MFRVLVQDSMHMYTYNAQYKKTHVSSEGTNRLKKEKSLQW